ARITEWGARWLCLPLVSFSAEPVDQQLGAVAIVERADGGHLRLRAPLLRTAVPAGYEHGAGLAATEPRGVADGVRARVVEPEEPALLAVVEQLPQPDGAFRWGCRQRRRNLHGR